ncbi:MAG: hypothetical protein AAF789_02070 [Bacteroidota bacterium]
MKTNHFIAALLLSSITTFGQTIRLEGLYATSTALPFGKYSVYNLFDNDPSTIWKTLKGTGPNEGIMMIFPEPTYIGSLVLQQAKGIDFAEVTTFLIYVDGQNQGSNLVIDKRVNSLYIKILRTKSDRKITSEIDGKKYSRNIFYEDFSVGLSEIKLLGDDDGQMRVIIPKKVNGSIQASSSLKPELAYGTSNLMDSRKEFGWVEGASGNGIGEEIIFEADEDIRITAVKIWNGYQRSPSHFSGNSRLKSFQFGLEDQQGQSYSLDDTTTPQTVTLGRPITGRRFVLTIEAAYSGSKYRDLVLSELKFFDGETPIMIRTKSEEERITETKAAAENNDLLKTFLDRNIDVILLKSENKSGEGSYYSESHRQATSLLLRSNNTFVIYEDENYHFEEYIEAEGIDTGEDTEKQLIADGNWELKETGSDYLEIRIFGKILNTTPGENIYGSTSTEEKQRIFQDFLTLKKGTITGERFISDIPLLKN